MSSTAGSGGRGWAKSQGPGGRGPVAGTLLGQAVMQLEEEGAGLGVLEIHRRRSCPTAAP